jgi:hypothetical protein
VLISKDTVRAAGDQVVLTVVTVRATGDPAALTVVIVRAASNLAALTVDGCISGCTLPSFSSSHSLHLTKKILGGIGLLPKIPLLRGKVLISIPLVESLLKVKKCYSKPQI